MKIKCYINHEKKLNGLRKNATRKTKLMNKEIYHEMNRNKIEAEKKLAKAGQLVNTFLPVIRREDSSIPVWDQKRYAFLLRRKHIPATVNPKLWEQGKLNLNAGLFKVTDRIYQVRGFDTVNMTFIRGNTGWIVMEALTCKETAQAAIKLVNDYFGKIPIRTVIITHSHVDHYGGSLKLLDELADEDTKFIVPKNYVASVVQENIYAGVAMFRRAKYQYGIEMPKDEKGQVDIGIGKGLPMGSLTFMDRVDEIQEQYEVRIVDGVPIEFELALDSEAPSEILMYFPNEHSLCITEDCNATLHNLITLRGAKARDAVAWAKCIDKAIELWGKDLTSVFGVHNWPRFGKAECIKYLEDQRDIYQYIHDQTLRLINQGYTIEEVGRMVKVPQSLAGEWYNSEFYGTVNQNAKAVYQRYLGWYSSNPVDLNKLLPEDSAKKYVEYMGGEDRVLRKARKAFHEGEYQWVAEVTKQVIYANPKNKKAKLICADALEQLGYIAESGTWRNEYLKGAWELRHGITPATDNFISDDVLDNIPLSEVLYLFSIRLDGYKAGDLNYKINFVIPDRDENASTEVKRGVFRYLDHKLTCDAAVTVTMSKKILYQLVATNKIPDESKIRVEGEIQKWILFLSLRDRINPDFAIVSPQISNK